MKEELQTALTEILQKTLQGAETAKDFLTTEIPDVLGQLLMWHGAYSFIENLIGVTLFGIGCKWLHSVFINKNKIKWSQSNDITTSEIREIIKGCVAGFGTGIGLSYTNLTWLQIWIAPKVWLIEYMSNLVKK